MATCTQLGEDWTVVLRRQPARIVQSRAEGGHTDAFEIICCDCGDHPGLDDVAFSPELQRIRGRSPIEAAAERTRITSGCTRSLRWRTGRKR